MEIGYITVTPTQKNIVLIIQMIYSYQEERIGNMKFNKALKVIYISTICILTIFASGCSDSSSGTAPNGGSGKNQQNTASSSANSNKAYRNNEYDFQFEISSR